MVWISQQPPGPESIITFTSIQPSRVQVLVELVPNAGCPHGSISKSSANDSEGAEEVGACNLPSRKSVLNEAEKPSKAAKLPILCDCQSARP